MKIFVFLIMSAFLTLTATAATIGSFTAPPSAATKTYVIGMDDGPVSGDRDFQDLAFILRGNVSLVAGCGAGQTLCNPFGGWQMMQNPQENNMLQYWDGNSSDSTMPMGIGNYIISTGGFTGHPTSPNWSLASTQYFGTAGGGPAGFMFVPDNDGNTVTTEMTLEVSALSNLNWIGYSTLSDPLTTNILFSGPANPSSMITFYATGPFILRAGNGTEEWQSNGNIQPFAPFRQGADVPEPMTFALMGAGLVALGLLRRRQQYKN